MQARELAVVAHRAYAARQVDRALELCRLAIASEPSNPVGYNTRGAILTEEMRHDEARDAFANAVRVAPAAPEYRVNLAYSLALKGEFEAAESELIEALRLNPAFGPAYQNLSWVRRAADCLVHLDALERLKAAGVGDAVARSQYCFALGKWYDDLQEYDRAFPNFKEGNDLLRVHYDRRAVEEHVKSLKTVWSRQFVQDLGGSGVESDKPVFIVGMPRCGSSVLEHKLASHPHVAALGERPDISRIADAISGNHPRKATYPAWARDLPREAYQGFGVRYLEKFERLHPGKRRLIDKNLLNFNYLGLIRGMFPNAAVVDCRRDPIDTCLSCYFQNLKTDHFYKFSLETLVHYYKSYEEIMDHWNSIFQDAVPFQYETFVQDPVDQIDRVLRAIGLECESGGGGSPHIQTSSAFQARQPIYADSVARWRRYEKHVGPLIAAFG